MPSTRKIAQQAGVSVGTVSRVLNNKSGVSDDVRRRVMEVAQELRYAPQKRMPWPVNLTHVGLLVRPLSDSLAVNPFYSDVYHGVEQMCSDLRVTLSFSTLDLADDQLRTLPILVDDERIGGIIVLGAVPEAVIRQIAQSNAIPIVLVDNWYVDSPWDSVMLDNAGGAAAATEYLIEQGHTQIAFISGPDHPSIVERRAGYEGTILRYGLSSHIEYTADLGVEDGALATSILTNKAPEITGIVCANDMQALGAMRAYMELGRRVPEEVSITGFDDIAMAHLAHPPLTTVRVDRNAFGQIAVELLLGRAKAPHRPPIRCTMGVNLVKRASVSTPPQPVFSQ
jgi:LacI family transcriptional regulator